MVEKRKSQRIIIKVPIEIELINVPAKSKLKEGSIIRCVSENISSGGLLMEDGIDKYGEGGLLVRSKDELITGSMVKLNINMPLPGYNSDFFIEGKVIRTMTKEDDNKTFLSAIKFGKIIKHNFSKAKLDHIKRMLSLS